MSTAENTDVALDTSDVDKYVGKIVGGGHLKEPFSVTDIRRWVQAMDYPNPIHYEEDAAARTRFGNIVAPQSFLTCTCFGHGSVPAMSGNIPGSHVLFGGDEFWFYGPRIQPGDHISSQGRFDGYSLANTSFAGPTMFSRGDTLYVNQRNDPVAKQRSTMVRYLAEIAQQKDYYANIAAAPEFTAEQLAEFKRKRQEWIRSGQSGEGPSDVKVGDKLPTRVVGPHTVSTFTSEQRALIFNAWGTHYFDDDYIGMDAGWIPELSGEGEEDTSGNIGMEEGPASGHADLDKAKLIGMPRRYGYGSSIGVWSLDYVAYWAGDNGFIRHAKIDYRSPVFEDDITFIDGEVTDVRFDPLLGVNLASVVIAMTNQDGTVIAKGPVDVELRPL